MDKIDFLPYSNFQNFMEIARKLEFQPSNAYLKNFPKDELIKLVSPSFGVDIAIDPEVELSDEMFVISGIPLNDQKTDLISLEEQYEKIIKAHINYSLSSVCLDKGDQGHTISSHAIFGEKSGYIEGGYKYECDDKSTDMSWVRNLVSEMPTSEITLAEPVLKIKSV